MSEIKRLHNEISCQDCKDINCPMKLCLPGCRKILEYEKIMLKVKAKEALFMQGSPASGIYFLYKGKMKITSTTEGAKMQIIRLASDGDILGHRGFTEGNLFSVSAIALEDSEICFFEREIFQNLLKLNNDLAYRLVFFLASELGKMDSKLRNMATLTIKQRVALALLMIYESFGMEEDNKTLAFVMSRKEIAEMSGSVPDVVSRTLSELSDMGLISLDGKKILVPDLQQLQIFSYKSME